MRHIILCAILILCSIGASAQYIPVSNYSEDSSAHLYRKSKSQFVGGIVMTSIGGVATAIGIPMIVSGAVLVARKDETAAEVIGNKMLMGPVTILGGCISTIIGAGLIGGGVPLIVKGKRGMRQYSFSPASSGIGLAMRF